MWRIARFTPVALAVVLLAGASFAALPEADHLRFTGKTTMEWDSAPLVDGYNVYRGDLPTLPADYGACLLPNVPAPNASDAAIPPPGDSYFYLVTTTKQAHEGTMGRDSSGFERPNLNPCFALPPPLLDSINPNGPMADGVWQGKEAPRNPGIANDLNGLAGGGVYLHTGEFFLQEVDLEIPGRGLKWQHVRYYRSQIDHDGQQGRNWTFNYDRRVRPGIGNLTYMDGTGREDVYLPYSGTIWEPADPGLYTKLRQDDDGTFVLRERDGTLYRHFPLDGTPTAGRLMSIEDRAGNEITFLYGPDGHLLTAVDTLGRAIEYYWNLEGRLGSVVDYTGREVRYEYDIEGNLVSVRTPVVIGTSTGNDFPAGKTTVYGYSSGSPDPRLNHNLLSITAPGDATPVMENTYDPDDQLQVQIYGGTNATGIPAGGQYVYAINVLGTGVRETSVLDRAGHSHLIVSDSAGHITYEDVDGLYQKEHLYNGAGERINTLYAMGNQVAYGYDDLNPDRFQRGNLLFVRRIADAARGDGRGGPLAPIEVTYEYEPLYTQQRVIADPKGRASEYTYDYQEGDPTVNGVADLAAEWDISLTGVPLTLGDANRDGKLDQVAGNPVRLSQPDVTLFPGGRQALIEGAPIQPVETLFWYNEYGQTVAEIDPEYNVTTHDYFAATDPDGNGAPTPTPPDGRLLDSVTGGYLRTTTHDADPAGYVPGPLIPRRDNATNPFPAEILNDYEYDEVGNLVASIDGNGVRTSFEVNALGQLVSVRRGAVSARSINLDPDPPLAGFVAEQRYNERDELVERSVQDFGDLSGTGGMIETSFEFDILGNVVRMTREIGGGDFATTEYRYDGQERRIATQLPEGNKHTMAYDGRGLLDLLLRDDTDLDPYNGGGTTLADYGYDANGNLTVYIDGNGVAWPFVYDGVDRRVRATIDTDFPAESFFDVYYDADETIDKLEIVDSGGTVYYDAEYVHDELGRVVELRQAIRDPVLGLLPEDHDGDGYASIVTEYDRNSRRSRIYTDDRDFTDFDHDGSGRMVHKIDPLGNEVLLTYDANNNVVGTEEHEIAPVGSEVFVTTNAYDRLNRLTETVNNAGDSTRMVYDSRSNLIRLADALGNVTNYSYDGLDHRIETVRELRDGGGAPGPVIDTIVYRWAFDRNGRLTAATDPEGNVTSYSYDGLDRRIRDTFDDGTFIEYVYDGDDNVIQITDANGSVIQIGRDSGSRITERTITPAAGIRVNHQTYEYDPLNRLIRAVDQNDAGPSEETEVVFRYDSLNRVRSETTRFGSNPPTTVDYGYDGDGNRTWMAWPGGSISYSYDPLNRLINANNGVPAGFSASYSYIGPERIAERTHDNGTRKSFLDPLGTVDDGYDSLKRVTRLHHYDPANTAIFDDDYEYDSVGNIIREIHQHVGREDTWEYDSAYRVIKHNRDVGTAAPTEVQYTLDHVGNWLQMFVNGQPFGNTPNNLNEYDEPQSGGTRVDDGVADDFGDDLNTPGPDGVNLGHDKNGNLITEGTTRYEYDSLNRLVKVSEAGVDVARYVYDGLNRRIARIDFTASTTHRYLYDGDVILEERDWPETTVLRRYYHGAAGEVVAMQDVGSGVYYYLHEDVRGSIVMVTAPDGSVVERVSYGPWGEPRFEDDAGNPTGASTSLVGNPFLYQGLAWDPETRLYEERGAKFAPRFGRHLQRIPPGMAQGPLGLGLNVPRFWPCFVNWFGMHPFWWWKGHFWHPGVWHCGWWAWQPHWWWGGPWYWWQWRPWLWLDGPFDSWWTIKPWVFWWHHPFPWWGWQTWWPWNGWWGFWPYWGWLGWSHWIPVWGWIGWKAWWPWWGWSGWTGFWPTFGWWGWVDWWPGWTLWWKWHPWGWWGWWTWSPWMWHGYWGWIAFGFWHHCWGWLHWWPWGWWNWAGWLGWWGWNGWNPWFWWGWWSWWTWGVIRGFGWWWGPLGLGPWFCSFWPGWWWGWWWWLWPGCWLWRIGWWGYWAWNGWWVWWNGWWAWPWWAWHRWWGWWWPWWGWFA